MMLHTKYQGSRPHGFRQDFFFIFSLYKSMQTCDLPGQSHFGPQGHYLNKRGRSLLDDTSYQILRLYALWFQTRRFFHVFTIYAYVNL